MVKDNSLLENQIKQVDDEYLSPSTKEMRKEKLIKSSKTELKDNSLSNKG